MKLRKSMKKIAAALLFVVIIIATVVGGLAYLQDADDSENRLICEIREDLGYRDGLPTCQEIFG